MRVARIQHQPMLKRERGNPHIVCGDWGTLLPELTKHFGVVMGRLLIRSQHIDTRPLQETPEAALVGSTT